MNHSTEPAPSVPDLVREIVGDARELVQLELALAKREALAALTRARSAAIAVAIAASASLMALTVVLATIVVISGSPLVAAAIIVGSLAVVAIVSGVVALRLVRTAWLGVTIERIERDVKQIEERSAWITAPTKSS